MNWSIAFIRCSSRRAFSEGLLRAAGQLSASRNTSRDYFAKTFRTLKGRTPSAYRAEKRAAGLRKL